MGPEPRVAEVPRQACAAGEHLARIAAPWRKADSQSGSAAGRDHASVIEPFPRQVTVSDHRSTKPPNRVLQSWRRLTATIRPPIAVSLRTFYPPSLCFRPCRSRDRAGFRTFSVRGEGAPAHDLIGSCRWPSSEISRFRSLLASARAPRPGRGPGRPGDDEAPDAS
jgi:hypothetical protein